MSHCNHSKKKLCKEKKIGSDSSWRESCCLFYGWGKERRIGCARPKKTKERYENIPPNILRWDHATSKAPSGLLALLRIARPPRTRASFADVPLLPSAPPCRHLLHSSPTLFDTCRVTIGTRGGPGNSCQRGGGSSILTYGPTCSANRRSQRGSSFWTATGRCVGQHA